MTMTTRIAFVSPPSTTPLRRQQQQRARQAQAQHGLSRCWPLLVIAITITMGITTAAAAESTSQIKTNHHDGPLNFHSPSLRGEGDSYSLEAESEVSGNSPSGIDANSPVPEQDSFRIAHNHNDVTNTYLRTSGNSNANLRLPSAQQQLDVASSLFMSNSHEHERQLEYTYSSSGDSDENDSRIVGGTPAAPGYWPHQVQILIDGNFVCGGSLIASDLVVCAAHCTLYAGEVGLKRQYNPNTQGGSNSGDEVITIQTKLNHPMYGTDNVGSSYDIALYKLASPATVLGKNDFVSLNADASVPTDGEALFVTGWGSTSQGGSAAGELQQVSVDYITNSVCSGPETSYSAQSIHEDMMCAGHLGVGQKDACQGDSGGPLVIDGGSASNYNPHLLVGVVSWGSGCAQARAPGVYARISHFKDWLTQEAQKLSPNHHNELKWVTGGKVSAPGGTTPQTLGGTGTGTGNAGTGTGGTGTGTGNTGSGTGNGGAGPPSLPPAAVVATTNPPVPAPVPAPVAAPVPAPIPAPVATPVAAPVATPATVTSPIVTVTLDPNACCWATSRSVATPRMSNRAGCLNHQIEPQCSMSAANCESEACGNGKFIPDLTQVADVTASPVPAPTASPTVSPSANPVASPSVSPTSSPTASPTVSVAPTVSSGPSLEPSNSPSLQPSPTIKKITIIIVEGQELTTPGAQDKHAQGVPSDSITYKATFSVQETRPGGCVNQVEAFYGASGHERHCEWVSQVSSSITDPALRSSKVNDRCKAFGMLCPVSCGFCVP